MRFVVGCDYLRESWVQFYGTMGVERDWSEKGEEGRQSVAGCRTGVEGSLSLDMDILLSLPSPEKLYYNIVIAMHCCIIALLQFPARARVRCLNIQLPTYIPHPSIHPLNASGLRDSKEDPVCRSRKVTYYVPLESDHSEPPCHCLSCLRASRQEKKTNKTKQAVVNG